MLTDILTPELLLIQPLTLGQINDVGPLNIAGNRLARQQYHSVKAFSPQLPENKELML